MISLYIHIPFCFKKCGYCSFPVIPTEKLQQPAGMAEQYKTAIFRDILYRASTGIAGTKKKLRTIYVGGGTPLLMGSQYVCDIIEYVATCFDIDDLEELTIECNPYPYQQTLDAITHIAHQYRHISRVRFSCGIQSLDDSILSSSQRDCTFAGIQQFTKDLIRIKQPHMVYNYDFIAFGHTSHPPLTPDAHAWLHTLAASHQIDSFSLYTLELFAGAKWYHDTKDPLVAYQAPWDHTVPFGTSEDALRDHFDTLKHIFLSNGYTRYEISNYALAGHESRHNMQYRSMGEYIGIGLGAHGFVGDPRFRTETTGGRKQYIASNAETTYTKKECSSQDCMIEAFFLGLRCQLGVQHVPSYHSILMVDWEARIQQLVTHGLAHYSDLHLILTDTGMNVHHQVCTYLMKDM